MATARPLELEPKWRQPRQEASGMSYRWVATTAELAKKHPRTDPSPQHCHGHGNYQDDFL